MNITAILLRKAYATARPLAPWSRRFAQAGMVIVLTGLAGLGANPAFAQALLDQQGDLKPTEDRYTLQGQAGQAITVRMVGTSTDPEKTLDPVVVLLGPNGEKLAENDDAERSLNSRLVVTLPTEGTYTVLARALSGSGPYKLTVTPATDLDRIYFLGEKQLFEGKVTEAERTFNRGLASNANEPGLYWYRADTLMMQNKLALALSDYRQAQALFQKAGKTDEVNQLTEVINSLEELQKAGGM